MRITIDISNSDTKILNHDLENIEQWITDAVDGKIAACRSRLVDTWMPVLLNSPDIKTLPGTQDGLVEAIFSHPDYKDRSGRISDDALSAVLD
tara:strand:- start:66 stop:344 length:279 start_codon:yes stop_codon:yes gene_type:complete